MRSTWRVLAVAVLVAGFAVSAYSQLDDPFYKGLQDRGLRTLMEAYLKQKGTSPAAPAPGAPAAAGDASGKLALAALEVQKALAAQTIAERDAAFKSARENYEAAIAECVKALNAIPPDKTDDRNKARLTLLKVRMDLAKMIFEQWLKTDLEYLEITDRRGGDRNRALELIKAAAEQYKEALQDAQVWLSSLDQLSLAEKLKYENAGYVRQVRRIEMEAQYANAWVTYYLGWLLPADYKPQGKERTRNQILDDAITAFQAYTTKPDKVTAKWYSHMVIGMAYRELGKYQEALTALSMADNSNVPKSIEENLKIQVAFERALTLLRAGKFGDARRTIEDAANLWKEKLDTNVYGLSMPLIKAESYILEGQQKGDASIKEEGVKILRELHSTRKPPWPIIVEWVMQPLLGGAAPAEQDPFAMWVNARRLITESQQTNDVNKLKQAYELLKTYVEKKGPQDPNYTEALYNQAACLLLMNRKAEAVDLFRRVADENPKYQYAAAAAKYVVSIRGEIYRDAASEENRAAYEDALKWFVSKWLASDPDQQYFYGLVLYRGRKFIEAGDAFQRVPENVEHSLEAKYMVSLCRLEHFREKTLASRDKQLILSGARAVVKDLVAFADYALSLKGKNLPKDKEERLIDWAENCYVTAAEVYLYPEVELPADALPLLDAVEQKFGLADDTRGRVLKARIEANQKLNRLDEAQKVLGSFLKLAKPDEVGPVLRGLFKAVTDDVRELISRGQKDLAAAKVEQAKALGEQYKQWLSASAAADKAIQIENNNYDLAELYLAVGNYSGALAIYQQIGGPKPEEVKKGEAIKEDCVLGMARAYEGLGETAPDTAQARQHFEAALDKWRVLVELASAAKDKAALWDRRYHLFYCKYRLGEKDPTVVSEIAEALKSLEIMSRPQPLGGADPVLQKKFMELKAKVGA